MIPSGDVCVDFGNECKDDGTTRINPVRGNDTTTTGVDVDTTVVDTRSIRVLLAASNSFFMAVLICFFASETFDRKHDTKLSHPAQVNDIGTESDSPKTCVNSLHNELGSCTKVDNRTVSSCFMPRLRERPNVPRRKDATVGHNSDVAHTSTAAPPVASHAIAT